MKKIFAVLSVLVALMMALTSCGPQAPAAEECLIGISNSFVGSEWRAQMIDGMNLAADELGCTLIIESADTDVNGQIQQINNLINQGVKAIVINPGDVAGLKPTLEEAIADGIVVVAVDQEIDIPGGYNVVIDQKKWAMLSAEWLFGERLKGEGNVTLLECLSAILPTKLVWLVLLKFFRNIPGSRLPCATPACGTRPQHSRRPLTF
jgi:ribose transport system substrate-binding protein